MTEPSTTTTPRPPQAAGPQPPRQQPAERPQTAALASPPADLAARLRLLEAVETELRDRLGRLEQR